MDTNQILKHIQSLKWVPPKFLRLESTQEGRLRLTIVGGSLYPEKYAEQLVAHFEESGIVEIESAARSREDKGVVIVFSLQLRHIVIVVKASDAPEKAKSEVIKKGGRPLVFHDLATATLYAFNYIAVDQRAAVVETLADGSKDVLATVSFAVSF